MSMENNLTEQIRSIVGDRLKLNEPMSKHSNFRIGGPAKWFVEIKSVDELQRVIALADQNQIAHVILGGGSNILVNDEGVDGVVIKIAMRDFSIDGNNVEAEAGVLTASLARATAQASLTGLAWAVSLPGTIGGAVRGNAGCFGGEMKDAVVSVKVLRDGEVVQIQAGDIGFGYRESIFKNNKDIILSVTFQLKLGDPNELKKQLDETLSKRKASQPTHAGSAGCLFKNYEIENEEELTRLDQKLDIPSGMKARGQISVGWLIDQMDLKGFRIGDAEISEDHGNFVLNLGKATASDIVQIIAVIKTKARDEYGIQLKEEVQYMGF